MRRNFERWRKQYEQSKTGANEQFDKLTQWLDKHLPVDNLPARPTIVHGDFRCPI